MAETRDTQARAAQLDGVAEAYGRLRPAYPDELVDEACHAAGVAVGDRVLEIGCGPGQLTAALAARGLRIVAVEPGEQMIERARARVGGELVEFRHDRFEDVSLDGQRFVAVFSATAFHWVDPEVSWAKAASALEPGGSLVLLTHCAGAAPDSIGIERRLFAGVEAVAPDVASRLPRPREATEVLEGAADRRGDISVLWSWIGQFDVAAPEAATRFEDVRVLSRTVEFAWTAERLNAHRRTTSVSFRLGPERLAALEEDTRRIIASFGGEIRLPTLAVAAVARLRDGPRSRAGLSSHLSPTRGT